LAHSLVANQISETNLLITKRNNTNIWYTFSVSVDKGTLKIPSDFDPDILEIQVGQWSLGWGSWIYAVRHHNPKLWVQIPPSPLKSYPRPALGQIIIRPVEMPISAARVDEDFARQMSEFIVQYRPALNSLAKK